MHPIRLVAAACVLALAAPPAAAQLVDATPPGPLAALQVAVVDGRARIDALLPQDDDVTQARFRFLDDGGADLGRHYAPAGPAERVVLALPMPPGAALLAASVADGAGNAGPEATTPVDGSLRAQTLQREAPLPVVFAFAAALVAFALRRR